VDAGRIIILCRLLEVEAPNDLIRVNGANTARRTQGIPANPNDFSRKKILLPISWNAMNNGI
jgi:hypothetical protein